VSDISDRLPRYADWALAATASPRHVLLIRRLISRPDNLTFYLCWARQDQPATMTFFITIAGRRWPAGETFKLGKDVLGWDQAQARTWDGICRHTALVALAQLRAAAIRGCQYPQLRATVGAENVCHLGRCSAERSPVSGSGRVGLGPPAVR